MKRADIPNALTVLRLLIALVLFIILSGYLAARVSGGGQLGPTRYADTALGAFYQAHQGWLLNSLFVLFLLAAISDWLDGALARRWKVTSTFGRIADPFADKIIVSGSFILLVPLAGALPLEPWMVVAMIAREYLITSIRGYAESHGIAFPASQSGKLKMALQSLCLCSVFLFLANESAVGAWASMVIAGLIWATVLVTLYSGLLYVRQSRTLLMGIKGDVESSAQGCPPKSVCADP